MADDIKETKILEKAMLALLDDMAHVESRIHQGPKKFDAYPSQVQLAALRMILSAGFKEQNGTITWEGWKYRYSKHHPVRSWLKANWFPATVAAATILTGIAVVVTSALALVLSTS